MKRLMLVRHGESEWNATRRLQGQADIGLSRRGQDQARSLRAVIAALAPDRAVASSLRRARETAALLGFSDAEPLDALREIDVGDWTGEIVDDLMARDRQAYRGWRAGTHTPPRGEAWADFARRTHAVVEDLMESEAERLLVVAHGGVLRALLQSLLGLPPSRIVPVGPGSLTVLQHASANGSAEFRLEVFNFSPEGPLLEAPD